MVVFLIVLALIYCTLPWYIEVIAWIINLFLADTIPFIDELLMFVPIVSKLKKLYEITDVLEKYWKIILLIIVLIIGVVIYIIVK